MNDALIVLHASDNIAVAARDLAAGERVGSIVLVEPVKLGHKVARVALLPGDKVLKYGMPIGSMTAVAAPGEWIHMHNMKSDYLAPHLRDATGGDAA